MIEALSPLVPSLRRYARALLRERDAADDLVQEALVLHNLAISQLRQRSRRGLHVPLDEAARALPGRAPTQAQNLQHGQLLRALEELKEEHRSVLLLVAVEDLSYAEAARVLEVPLGTVMSRLSRARDALSLQLQDEPRARERRPTLRRLK